MNGLAACGVSRLWVTAYIPADLRTLLASRANPNAPFTWNGRYVGIPSKAWDEQYTTAQYLGGLRGTLPVKDWTWDVFAAYDNTDHLQSNQFAVLKSQVQNLLNAPDGGNSICAGGFNPFGVNHSSVISDSCLAYMSTTANSTEELRSDHVQGSAAGIDPRAAGRQSRARAARRPSPQHLCISPRLAARFSEHRSGHCLAAHAGIDLGGRVRRADRRAAAEGQAAHPQPQLRQRFPSLGLLDLGRRQQLRRRPQVGAHRQPARVRGGYQRAVRAPNIGELFAAASGSQIAFGTPPAAIGDPAMCAPPLARGANGASVCSPCLAQGVPSAVIDTYTFPTTGDGGQNAGQPLRLIPRSPIPTTSGCRGRRSPTRRCSPTSPPRSTITRSRSRR